MTLSAVITGDLIQSRKAQPAQLEQAMDNLRATALTLAQLTHHDLRFTRFRGDGWQVHLKDPNAALLACLMFHAHLRAAKTGIDSRMAIGVGNATSLGTQTLADATGTAFETSGQALDGMGKKRLVISGLGVTPMHGALLDLCDHIAFGWTAPQAQAMQHAMHDPTATQADIAQKLGITRQAVQLRLSGAGQASIMSAIAAFSIPSTQQSPT